MASRETGFRDYYKTKAADSGYRPNRNRRHPQQPNLLNKVADRAQVIHDLNPLSYAYEKGKEYFPGTLGIAQRGWESARDNWIMHSQNKDYFGGNWLDSKVPNKVKESLMTPKDKDFFDKYMRLAELTTDPDKRKQYIDTANTARQNMQITGRLNYGLGQIDPEGTYLNKKGLPSYSADLFGEGYNRFNLEKFKEAMGMGEGILGGLEALDRHPDALDSYEKETFGIDEKTREQKIQEMHDAEMEKIKNFETDYHSDLLDDMAKDQWPPSGYKFEFDEHVQNKIDALKNAPLDKREDYIRKQNEYVPPVIPELGEPNPQLDFPITEGPMPEMSIEFGADEGVAPPPIIPFDDSGREEGIMRNMMPQQRRDEDHPLWDQYWNFLIDEGDSYDNIQGGPPTFEQYLGAWERINKLPRGLHYGERHITPHWMKG